VTLLVVSDALPNRILFRCFAWEITLITVVLWSHIVSRKWSLLLNVSSSGRIKAPGCLKQWLEENITLDHSRHVGVVVNKLLLRHIETGISRVMLIKRPIEFVSSLTLRPSPFDNDRVCFGIKFSLKFSNVNLASKLLVQTLKGSFNKLEPQGRRTSSQHIDVLVVLNQAITVLIKDSEHAFDIYLGHLELKSQHSSREFIQVQSTRVISVQLIKVLLEFDKTLNPV
jgi:hypothetical protein